MYIAVPKKQQLWVESGSRVLTVRACTIGTYNAICDTLHGCRVVDHYNVLSKEEMFAVRTAPIAVPSSGGRLVATSVVIREP